MEIEASLFELVEDKLEAISDLTFLPECFRGPLKTLWRATCGPRAANCLHRDAGNFKSPEEIDITLPQNFCCFRVYCTYS